MDKPQYLVPGAILGGAVIIAAGLYFGLQGRAPSADPAAPQKPPAAAEQPSSKAADPPSAALQAPQGPAAAIGLSPPSVSPELQASTEKAAKEALAKLKKDVFLPQCWTPALTAQPKPAVAKFQLDVTFNPQGQSVTVGVGEDRSAERYDVAQCLRGTVIVLNIPPPGATVRTILPLEFP